MGQDMDWRLKKTSVVSRTSFMFNNSLISDVKFVVFSQKTDSRVFIPAHKFVLGISSPVFFAMFYGNLAVVENTVALPDCDSEGLLEFLRYIYCDTVELSLPSAIQALYLAKKYLVPSLAKICVSYIKENVTPAHVLDVIPYAMKLDEKELLEKCFQVIDLNANVVLKSRSFLEVSLDLLENLLDRDTLCISEVEIFQAVQRWLLHNHKIPSMSRPISRKGRQLPNASNTVTESSGTPVKRVYNGMCTCRCQERCDCVTAILHSSRAVESSTIEKMDTKESVGSGHRGNFASGSIDNVSHFQSVTPNENMSRIQRVTHDNQNQNQAFPSFVPRTSPHVAHLYDRLIRKIRFPLMLEEEFKKHVVPSKLLPQQDVIDILVNFGTVKRNLDRFSSKPRNNPLRRCSRYSTVSHWFLYSGERAESFIMSVNTPIRLHGIRLYGYENCQYKVELKVYPRSDPYNKQIAQGYYMSEVQGTDNYHGYDVKLDTAIRIENDVDYNIEATIKGPPSAYGKEGHSSVDCGKVKFNFRGEENSVFQNFSVGQFAEIIFFEL
ncbi:uncharacterized protein LOC116295851 [Actinia tenebrosa]|uniref:Uncharacterized protein LOC116295851 n=1 Tax=Actinia tenebrosa TaxID=6105 RepID=A0A6P8HTI3_ACTTE|nr:uncharacterized protein LOC116295851 [Actinia tenebrosa]